MMLEDNDSGILSSSGPKWMKAAKLVVILSNIMPGCQISPHTPAVGLRYPLEEMNGQRMGVSQYSLGLVNG